MNRLLRSLQLPPRSFQAEQAVIRAVLSNNELLPTVRKLVSANDFHNAAHEAIFRTIQSMHDFCGRRKIDAEWLATKLAEREGFREIGGDAAFAAILEGMPRKTRMEDPGQLAGDALGDAEDISVCLADVEPSELTWLWKPRVPIGCLTVVAGPGGRGKSLLAIDMASRVTTGTPFFDTPEVPNPKGSVVLISAQDPIKTVVVPRLVAAGADRSRVRTLRSKALGRLRLDDIAMLDEIVAERTDTRLLIIDAPLALAAGTTAPGHSRQRSLIHPLGALAETHGIAVVLVTQGAERTLSSVSWGNSVRAVWSAARDDGDTTRFLLRPLKNNLAPEAPKLAYRISEEAPRIDWEILVDPDDMSRAPRYSASLRGRAPEKSARAAEWLWSHLQNGPVPIQQVVFAAQQAGILLGDSLSPLYNAKNRLPEIHSGFAIEQFEAPYGEFDRPFIHWKVVPTTMLRNDEPITTSAQDTSATLRSPIGNSEP